MKSEILSDNHQSGARAPRASPGAGHTVTTHHLVNALEAVTMVCRKSAEGESGTAQACSRARRGTGGPAGAKVAGTAAIP